MVIINTYCKRSKLIGCGGGDCLELQRGQVGNIKNNKKKYTKQENRVIEKKESYH